MVAQQEFLVVVLCKAPVQGCLETVNNTKKNCFPTGTVRGHNGNRPDELNRWECYLVELDTDPQPPPLCEQDASGFGLGYSNTKLSPCNKVYILRLYYYYYCWVETLYVGCWP